MQKFIQKQRYFWALFFSVFVSWSAQAQVTLGTSPYTQDFDGIGTGLPTGWSTRTGGTATALGATATYASAATAWNSTTGNFRNSASADGSASGDVTATQAGRTDRVLSIRQSGSFGDPGGAFLLQLANTTGKTGFQLSFKLQSLDIASPRTTTWRVDYGFGTTPTTFTAATTSPATLITGGSTFTNTNVTVDFGTALDNQAGDVWIRIVTVSASTGGGNRATTGVDDVSLSFSGGAAPDIAISSPAQVAAANVQQATTNHILSAFKLDVTTSAASLTGLTVNTTGTYTAADLQNLKVRYSTDATLDAGDATLSTKTTGLDAGSQVFPTFTAQNIPIGSGFVFVTADFNLAATVGRTIAVNAIAPADITFAAGNKTGTVTAAGTQTVIAIVPANVALATHNTVSAASISKGTNNHVLSSFRLAITTANATLTGVTVTTAGTYTATDVTNFKVRYSTDATLDAGDATLATKTTGLTAGTQAFAGLSQLISNGSTGYIFITTDFPATAVTGNTINVQAIANTDVTFVAANVTGSANVGGVQTIAALSIAGAKTLANGSVVTLSGVITVSKQFGGTVFFQDATGGMAIFDNRMGNPLFNDPALAIGKEITVTGTLAEFQPTTGVTGSGLRQLSPITAYTIGANVGQPAPIVITGAMTEADEGRLVQINNASLTDRGLVLPGANYRFNYGAVTNATFRTPTTTFSNFDLLGKRLPAGNQTFVGVVGQFRGTYQLQPRLIADVTNLVPHPVTYTTVPKSETLDVIAWNLEWFGFPPNGPANTTLQKDNAAAVLRSLDVDVIILSEICNVALFNDLVAAMPGYAGKLSPCWSYTSGTPIDQAQKIGFIYRTANITPDPAVNGGNVSCYMSGFVPPVYPTTATSFWASGRLPALLVADATFNGVTRKLHLFGIHAKANGDLSDYNRRKSDIEYFKQQLDTDFPNANIIIGGDYNDDVDVTVSSNPLNGVTTYAPFVNDPARFKVNTVNLSNDNWRSYLTQVNVIDHIAMSNELYDYSLEGSSTMPDVFSVLPTNDYGTTTSDHLPVFTRFLLTKPVIKVADGMTNIANNTATITDLGLTTVGTAITKSITINNTGNAVLNLSGLTLPTGFSLVGTLPTGIAAGGNATLQIRLDATTAGTFQGNLQVTTNDVIATPFIFPIKGVVNAVACGTIGITPTAITATASTGTAYTTVNFAATGGTAPYTFTVSAGTLPSGLTLTAAGVLSGTPTASGTYNFTVTATDAGGNNCTGNRAYTISVSCPTITMTPAIGALTSGSVGTVYTAVNFVATGGNGAVNYTITAGSVPTGLTLSTAGALTGTPTVAGNYAFSVTGTDANNCAITQAYTIAITCASVNVTTQPTNQNICTATTGNTNFSVAATTAAGTLTYQWQENNGAGFADITNGGVYSNATTNTLTLTGVGNAFNNRSYRCIITNTNGATVCATNSNAADLTISVPVNIGTHPTAQNVCATKNATFTVAATGTALTYQWQEKVGAGAFTNITNGGVYSGATTATLTLTGVTVGMSTNQYQCIVSGACPSATSTAAALTVSPFNATPTLDPINDIATVTSSSTLTVNLSGISMGAGDTGQTLTVTATSSNTAVVPNPTVTYTSPSSTGTIQFAPTPGQTSSGIATITVTVADNGLAVCENTVTRTFTVRLSTPPLPPPPAKQTITFDSIPDFVFSRELLELKASASSGLPVSFTLVSGNAILYGGKFLQFTGLGEIVVRAEQTGNNLFNAATAVTRRFKVTARPQTLSGFAAIADRPWNSESFVINASSNTGLPVTFTITEGSNIAEIVNGNIVRLKAAVGKVTITASQNGDAVTSAATSLTQSFNVTKADQTITNIAGLPSLIFGNNLTQRLSATASSGLPVSFAVLSGNATLNGDQLIFNSAGNVVVTYTQAGNDLWNAAVLQSRTYNVAKANQEIFITIAPSSIEVGSSTTFSASVVSGLPVTMRIVSGEGNVNGLRLTPTGGTSITVEFNQAGNENYNAAPPVLRTIVVTPTLSIGTITGNKFCGGSTVRIDYTVAGLFNSNNIFAVYLSDANGNFNGGRLLVGIANGQTSGTIIGNIPTNVPQGTGYRLRIEGLSPAIFSAASTQTIELNPLPTQATVRQEGAELISSIATGIQWFANGTAISGATNQKYTPTEAQANDVNTLYTVVVTSSGGCTSISSPVRYQKVPVVTGIEDANLSAKLSVYPNPTTDKFLVELGMSKAGKVTLRMVDALGKEVYAETITTATANLKHEVQMTDMASGVYVLMLNVDGKVAVKRVVKQ